MNFFFKVFDTSDFPPRWHCGAWTAGHGWLHILSDLGVWGAYLAIPCVLGYFVLRRRDVPFSRIFWLFGAFILACGTTHLMEAVIFWWPAYRLAGLIKLFTAAVSWGTVLALIPIVPVALTMRSPEALEKEISERKRAEEALRLAKARLELAVRGSNIGIWEIDMPDGNLRHGRIDFTNFLELLGYERSEQAPDFAAGMSLVHPEDQEKVLRAIEAYLGGQTRELEIEHRCRHKDGSERWMLARGVAMRDPSGKAIRLIGSSIDISERKRLEAELRQAKEAAEAANRAKDGFLANVSHEIRTPMNAILGMTELALDTPLSEDQRQCLDTVKSAAESLLNMINDLLDFSKIEAGKLELDRGHISLRASLGDTVRGLGVRAHKKGLELVCHVQPDVPDALIGDAGRLRQVVLNLVGNAIKFTERGEVVVNVGLQSSDCRLQVEKLTQSSADLQSAICNLQFEVRDTGIGIPHDKQEIIFQAFEQEDTSTTRRYGGTGLGLTIAARLVALMGGTINVSSAPGRGSTFTFSAQFERQTDPAEPISQPALVLLRDRPVLIVDDNATNRHILKEWLRGCQMHALAVADGTAALDALWHGVACGKAFALILLDKSMPDIDGLELAAKIRQHPELSATRIIMLTSGDRPGDLARARELGIHAHLLKPVPQEELIQTIHRVMSETNVDAQPLRKAAPAATALPPQRILVAEDNEFNTRHIERLLVRQGHTVRLANNGRESLALLGMGGQGSEVRDQKSEVRSRSVDFSLTPDSQPLTPDFDLLLLDLHMPELDGFQVVQAIRAHERVAGGHLPVIALTARSQKEDRERCLAAGMDDYLSKPVRTAELFAAMERLICNHGCSEPASADAGPRTDLVDATVLLGTCGDDADGLRELCQDFRTYVPPRMAAINDTLQNQDAPRLREAAHKLCGLLGAFSTVAGKMAGDLEDHAAGGRLDDARPLVRDLGSMVAQLIHEVNGITLESLHRQAERARATIP